MILAPLVLPPLLGSLAYYLCKRDIHVMHYRFEVLFHIMDLNSRAPSDSYSQSRCEARLTEYKTVSAHTMFWSFRTPLSYWYSQYDFNLPESPITPSADLDDSIPPPETPKRIGRDMSTRLN